MSIHGDTENVLGQDRGQPTGAARQPQPVVFVVPRFVM